jgi:hypothetical protein
MLFVFVLFLYLLLLAFGVAVTVALSRCIEQVLAGCGNEIEVMW